MVHSKWFIKLAGYGIHYEFFSRIENFLSNWSHNVTKNGEYSEFLPVKHDVMQGMVLIRPLSFYFIHKRLPSIVPAPIKCFLFADDANAYDKVKTVSNCLRIKLSLNAVFVWSPLWQLPLNIPECIVLHLDRGNNTFFFHINGIQLPSEDIVSDLCITISRDLTYHEHVKKILVKCHNRLFIIKKSFNYKNSDIYRLIFTTYMRPILEYGSLL